MTVLFVTGCTAAGKPWVGAYLDRSTVSWSPQIQLSFLDETVFGDGDFEAPGIETAPEHNPMSLSGFVRGDSMFAHIYIQFPAKENPNFPYGDYVGTFRGRMGDSIINSYFYPKTRRFMLGTITFEKKQRLLKGGTLFLFEDKYPDQH
jgi:hypothetical protein